MCVSLGFVVLTKKCVASSKLRTKNAHLRCCYTYDSIVSARVHETGEYIFSNINVPMQRQRQTLSFDFDYIRMCSKIIIPHISPRSNLFSPSSMLMAAKPSSHNKTARWIIPSRQFCVHSFTNQYTSDPPETGVGPLRGIASFWTNQ